MILMILLRRFDNHNILNVDGVGDVVVDPQVLPDLADSLAAVRADVAPPVMYPLHVQPDITLLTERFPTLKHDEIHGQSYLKLRKQEQING